MRKAGLLTMVLALGLSAEAQAGPSDPPKQNNPTLTASGFPRDLLRSGCNHYENRARFMSREGRIEFVVMLAEACVAAEKSLDSDVYGERLAAEYFLKRVLRLRNTVIDINMRRVYGSQTSPWARPITPDGQLEPVRRVSNAGEYLIAHRMGLFNAYQDWLDSGASFSIAFVR